MLSLILRADCLRRLKVDPPGDIKAEREEEEEEAEAEGEKGPGD